MTIHELKILFDLNPESKSKILDECSRRFRRGYFFVDSDDGHCYLFNRRGKEKDVSMIHEINEDMILNDIKKIAIPNNVVNIGYRAFGWCISLKNVTISDSVTNIRNYAFSGCSGLTSVTIPNSVTSIGDWAFYSCNNLKSLVFKNKTIDQVKSMENYPFGIEDESVIKTELS